MDPIVKDYFDMSIHLLTVALVFHNIIPKGVEIMRGTWEEDIKYVAENSSRMEIVTDQDYSEWNYYDEYDNLVMKKYCIPKELSYSIYKHTYDQNNELLQTIEYQNNMPICKIDYTYKDGKLIESKEYKTDTYKIKSGNVVDDLKLLRLANVHYYVYMKDCMEERVCLPSGDTSYYKIHEGEKIKYLNPFHMSPKWILDSIENETFGVTIKEEVLTSDILDSVVRNLRDKYVICRWIIIDAFSSKITTEENKIISELLQTYERNWNIRVDFG